LAEADLATQRLHGIALHFSRESRGVDVTELVLMQELYLHLSGAISRIFELPPLPDNTRVLLQQAVSDLDPERGFDPERYLTALSLVRPQLISIAETIQQRREKLRSSQSQDIDALVARTALVILFVVGATILLGICLSLTFARRILRRIQILSDSAGRIARGELVPPPAPEKVRDELDDLGLSINRMTERLIRVVGAEKLLEGAEEERRRIAMDIHDQTLADLSSVLRGIQGLKDKEGCRPEAAELEEDLRRAMGNLREVMDNLHPQTLEILGLGAALQSHLESHFDRGDMPEYHLCISPEAEGADLSRLVRLTLYRITVEAVHNVIKHARAERYEVSLDQRREMLVLCVEDNGVGFGGMDPTHQGRGLNNIRERAHAIGAEVSWGPSRFTTGTRFELTLPLRQH
jgi:signal transduction histidine kinase